jgi:hypothetical protein
MDSPILELLLAGVLGLGIGLGLVTAAVVARELLRRSDRDR